MGEPLIWDFKSLTRHYRPAHNYCRLTNTLKISDAKLLEKILGHIKYFLVLMGNDSIRRKIS
jgi:hypothetical protein